MKVWVAGIVVCVAMQASARSELKQRADGVAAGIPQELQLSEYDFQPGESSGWHFQHGIALGYVVQGDMRLTIKADAPVVLHAGDSFKVGRDTPHVLVNTGPTEARVVISFMLDRGSDQRILMAKPHYAP